VKILGVEANNRKKSFEVQTREGTYSFPFAKLEIRPSADDPIKEVFPDEELGMEGFTCRLRSGAEDTVHLDAVLEYNRDSGYLSELLLHELTVEALKALEESGLSKRELIRRLGTSPSQFYRLLDPTYYGKSAGQMLALLHLLGKEVDLVVRAS
jgi:hypothetical protein